MKIVRQFWHPEFGYKANNNDVRQGRPIKVRTFRELVAMAGLVSVRNPQHLILWRGQSRLYKQETGSNQGKICLFPSLYRPSAESSRRYVDTKTVAGRWDLLSEASRLLLAKIRDAVKQPNWNDRVQAGYEPDLAEALKRLPAFRDFNIEPHEVVRLARFPELLWAILQHYSEGNSPTPFLDVSHSLHVAASFAASFARKDFQDSRSSLGYVFGFGVPFLKEEVTYSPNQELMVMRLESATIANNDRAFIQQGLLLGTFPVRAENIRVPDLDPAKRLVVVFELEGPAERYWEGFGAIPDEVLYPSATPDPVLIMVRECFADLARSAQAALIP